MTIGRNNEAPAAYALTSTIRRLLDHLTEADLFSSKDLDSMSQTLEKLAQNVENAESRHEPYVVALISKRVERCLASLQSLRERLLVLEEPLPSIHEKLISILRSMSLANTRSRVRIN
jgi:DNA-directed RNA polymerase specialized sigma24 family protein